MTADERGNNIAAVGVPIGGYLAYAPDTADVPSPVEGGALDFVLPADYRRAGLLKSDGGFEWTEEPEGDPIDFWQEGYEIPSGAAAVTLTFTTAENSPITRALRTGKTPDENGYLTVDGGGVSKRYTFFSEEVYRNGDVRRRAAIGRVRTAKLQKSERGSVQGIEFTIDIVRSEKFGGEHYGEWMLYASDEADPPVEGDDE